MDQKVRKKIVVLLSTMVLIGISVFAVHVGNSKKVQSESQLADLILSDGSVVKPWHNKEDDVTYYFIPSYSELGEASFASTDGRIEIDGKEIKAGELLDGFQIGENYSLRSSNSNQVQDIQFRKSENVSTIYIRTANESLEKVMDSKTIKEIARVTVVDEDGNISIDTTDSKIKSRGNSSWYEPKKPLSVLLENQESILGMKASDKWVLTSNSMDYSSIRNKMVFDAANEIGMPSTPELKYVDLYLNGDYRGLYLLTQAPDTFYQWTDVDEDGLYLFTAELPVRESRTAYPIWTQNNEALVDVCLPENMHTQERETAEDIIQHLDKEMSADNENIADVIDIDSWAKKYLLDEVFIDFDSGLASAYFYKSTTNGDSKVYAGPIWDYDNILGNENGFCETTANPDILFAKNEYRAPELKVLWYSDLYNNQVFHDRAIELFNESFAPVIEKLLDGGIEDYQKQIAVANANNDIRWNQDSVADTKHIQEYLAERYSFLKSIWQDGEEYYEVVGNGPANVDSFMRLYLKKGEAPADNQYYEQLFGDAEWYIDGTDEAFDPTQPISENISIRKGKIYKPGFVDKVKQKIWANKDLVKILVTVVFMLGVLLILSLSNMRLIGRRVNDG